MLRPRVTSGFSLIEMLVVVVILAILAAIAVAGFRIVIANTQDQAAMVSITASAQQAKATSAARADYAGFLRSDFEYGGGDTGVLLPVDEPSTGHGELSVAVDGTNTTLAAMAMRSDSGNCARGRLDGDQRDVWLTETPPQGCIADLSLTPGDDGGGGDPGVESLTITASARDSAIELFFTPSDVPSATAFTGACWTAAMTEANPVTVTGTGSPLLVSNLENWVVHRCQVAANTGVVSNQVLATPVGDTLTVDPPGSVTPKDPVIVGPEIDPPPPTECTGIVCYHIDPGPTPTRTPTPDTSGIWDVSSFYSSHAGAHQLFFIDRDADAVGFVYDGGSRTGQSGQMTFVNATNTAAVTFSDPTGLAYGAHPARGPASQYTTFAVQYLTDAGSDAVWMLDVAARRAHQVATGLTDPTGVTWASCRSVSTGAATTVSGANQCLYVATANGVVRVPLLTTVDAFGSLQPTVAGPDTHAVVSETVATKVFASDDLWSDTATTLTGSPYTGSAAVTANGSNPEGSVFIPASVTGATNLVVFVDAGDHRVKSFNPASPGNVTVVAGTGTAGYADGVGSAAAFDTPRAVHFHGAWPEVYVADTGNDAIRKVNLATGAVTTVLGPQTFQSAMGWGNNGTASPATSSDNGVLAQPDITKIYPTPVPIGGALSGKSVTSVSMGYMAGCAVANGQAYCWGENNAWGTQGTGAAGSITPTPVSTAGVLAGRTVTKIAADSYGHTCAVLDNGTAACWGFRNRGQVGNGTSSASSGIALPVLVQSNLTSATLTGVTDIAVGYEHTCAIASGNAYCWGNAGSGRLGDGQSTTNRTRAVLVGDTDLNGTVDAGAHQGETLVGITAGSGHTCAVAASGAAYCWGANTEGRLGDNTLNSASVPVAVSRPSGVTFTAISTGDKHTCAISQTGRLYCWGAGGSQLGDGYVSGTAVNRLTPVPVYTKTESSASAIPVGAVATAVSAGGTSTCAIADGVTYCWGFSSHGKLGNNLATAIQTGVPVAVTTGGGIGSRRALDVSVAEFGHSVLAIYGE